MATIYSFDPYAESWIEVSSQPSSSSLSSAAADDTSPNALRLHPDPNGRRRGRSTRNELRPPGAPIRSLSAAGSSQEEYEESESESDHIMSSSNEAVGLNISHTSLAPASSASDEASSNNAEEDDGDDDENSTAIGVPMTEPVFTPQPHAFSQPPQTYTARHARSLETRTSYFPAHRTSPHRRTVHSYPNRSRNTHTPFNIIAPSHTADHDAALRASLSTLLSCAAAARGLPKQETSTRQQGPIQRPSTNRIEPATLRIVHESTVTSSHSPLAPSLPPRPSVRHRTSTDSLSSIKEKGKRKASRSKDRNRTETSDKKRRASSPNRDTQVSPTLMTWVVSAGVVVLFSAISFSAGYTIGKEVGRVEAGALGNKEGIVCGKEVGRGFRKLRWGGSSISVIKV